ncbi:MAG: MFS transporter [Chloroflexota bacterium]|nr:MFS transporter [Chloroflexota bacterium]
MGEVTTPPFAAGVDQGHGQRVADGALPPPAAPLEADPAGAPKDLSGDTPRDAKSDGSSDTPADPARPGAGHLAGTFDSLRVRDYRLLFQGSAVTSIGFWMQQVALGWLVLDLTNSPFYLGLASFARSFPMLVVSPFGGVLADRLNRRFLILSTQVAQLILTAALAVLVFTGVVTISHVLIASLLMGVAMSMHVPARQALIPALVGRHRLSNALALYSMSLNTSRIIGPSLAGAVMGLAGVGGCLALQSAGYVWAVVNVLQIRSGDRQSDGRASSTVMQNLIEGFRYCYRTKAIFTQLLIAAVPTIFAYPYMNFLPSFARDQYRIGPEGLGLLMTCMGLGALAGSFALASRRQLRRKSLVTVICAGLFGLSLCLFAMAPWLPLALVFLAFAGASSSVYMTLNGTILQEICPDEYRGRVSSVYMVTWGMMPLGAVPAGALAEAYGAPLTVFVGGAICLVFAVGMLLFRPQLRSV